MEIYLLLKYFKRQTTEQEGYEVQQWLASDDDGSRAAEYRRAHLLFTGMAAHWNPTRVPKKKKLFQSVRKLVYAASAAAVAAVAVFVTAHITKVNTIGMLSRQMAKIVVPPCRPIQFTLSDDRKLWLNASSGLISPTVFSTDDRTVNIVTGEAMYDTICSTSGLIDIADVPPDEMVKKSEIMNRVDIVTERNKISEVNHTCGKAMISGGLGNGLSTLSKGFGFT